MYTSSYYCSKQMSYNHSHLHYDYLIVVLSLESYRYSHSFPSSNLFGGSVLGTLKCLDDNNVGL